MRIEKISDKQIRCTLTSDDLSNRHINIGELAYGTEKARALFREMLTQASREVDFHAENIPLMIEAVPVSGDSLVLVITKVEDPDELDTRFSRFSSAIDEEELEIDALDSEFSFEEIRADDVIEEFARLCAEQKTPDAMQEDRSDEDASVPDYYRIYRFSSIDEVCRAGRALRGAYDAENTLYKEPDHTCYYLVLHKGDHSPETFNKICNILSEYADCVRANAGTAAYYDEHFKCILADHALQALQKL